MVRDRRRWPWLAAAVFCCAAAAPAPVKVIKRIDLSKPFGLPPGATFTATQGPDVDDPAYEGQTAPGRIHLCLRVRASAPCAPNLDHAWDAGSAVDEYSEIHFLYQADVIRPSGSPAGPVLLIRTASHHTGNGDHFQSVQLIGYRSRERRFVVVLREQAGANNNQEIRFLDSGPLKGVVISNQPTDDAPFAYWINVYRAPSASADYQRVLRYRSATRYNDGNPLAVIDSEMPNILRRLGLWRPGQRLPMPESGCARPRLVKLELWCN